MEKVNDCVLKELRKRNIKLWLPPYFYSDNDDGKTESSSSESSSIGHNTKKSKQGSNQVALQKLASVWSTHALLSSGKESEEDDGNDANNTILKEDIYQSLIHFQTKALERLKAKKEQKKNKGGTKITQEATPRFKIRMETTHSKEVGDTFTIKLLGLHLTQNSNLNSDNNSEHEKGTNKIFISTDVVSSLASFSKKWAQTVKVKCESLTSSPPSSSFTTTATNATTTAIKEGGPMVVTLTLQKISPTLIVSTFLMDLKKQLNIDSTSNGDNSVVIRMIYQGTNILQSLSSYSTDCFYEVVSSHNRRHCSSPFASRDEGDEVGPTILCLISPLFLPSSHSTTLKSCSSNTQQNQTVDDLQIINSVKNAASRITKTSEFDITDQNGKIVSMTNQDRLAFLITLGLHKLGQRQLYVNSGGDINNINDNTTGSSADEESIQSGIGGTTDAAASALTFLLEADAEWNNHSSSVHSSSSSSSEKWKTKADNYGLLQLDIAWSYLKLQSMEHLPDAIQRLDIAENVLRKQVHSNFVTLALVQAEMEHGIVPPLAAVFVKLFLLQGVGYMHSAASVSVSGGCIDTTRLQLLREKGEERLNRAYLLCQRLRNASPPVSVLHLQEVVSNLSKYDAISALRKCNGNADAAVELLEKDRKGVLVENQKRLMQKKIGLCENGMDYVNLDLVHQLGSILALEVGSGMGEGEEGSEVFRDYQNHSYGNCKNNDMMPGYAKNRQIIQSLLRQSNNDIGKSVDLYQTMQMDGDEILHRGSNLDNHRAVRNDRKKSRSDVDEMALATLESMGVEESMARMALQKTQNNVDASVFWLTEQNQDMKENEDMVSTSDSSSSSPSMSTIGSKRVLELCGDVKPTKTPKKDSGNEDIKKGKKIVFTSGNTIETKTFDEKLVNIDASKLLLEKNGEEEEMKSNEGRKQEEEEEEERLRCEKEETERLRREQEEEEERLMREKEEEDAVQMLQDLLMKQGDDSVGIGYYIGSDLDEEWSLIQKYQRHL